jgi:hypothetical protein
LGRLLNLEKFDKSKNEIEEELLSKKIEFSKEEEINNLLKRKGVLK